MSGHITKYRASRVIVEASPVRVVRPGVKLPDNPTRVTVTDEDSLNKALELLSNGPVLISTKYKMYVIKDFDQGMIILNDQLASGNYTVVEAAPPVKPYTPSPMMASQPKPSYPPLTASSVVRVTDDPTFDKALELVTKGPVTISWSGRNPEVYKDVTDFDRAAEIMVSLLQRKKFPTVDSRKREAQYAQS